MAASDTGPPNAASSNATLVAVVFSVAIGVASARVLIPRIYGLREEAGLPIAAAVALATFASPVLAGGIRRILGSRAAITCVAVAQAFTWVALQRIHPIPWPLAAAATALGLIAWTLLLHAMRSAASADGFAFAATFLIGLTLDTAIHAAFRTWDVSWQDGWSATATSVVLAVCLVLAALRGSRSLATPVEGRFRTVAPLAGIGVYLVLSVLFLQNVAFVDSVTGFGVMGGALVALLGDLAALAGLIWWSGSADRRTRALDATVLVVAAWFLTSTSTAAVVLSLVIAAVVAAQLLGASLSVGYTDGAASAWRTSLAVALGGLAFVLCVLLYQLHITNPLPLSNRWIPVIAAVALGAAGLTRRAVAERMPRRAILVPAWSLLIAPALVVLGSPSPAAASSSPVRVLDWNVHSAIDADGMLDPASIAEEIRAQGADVVVLQEIPRGWVIAGSLDLAEWLADDLGMSMAWAPAADGQFGNVILSTNPITDRDVIALPYGAGPQHRSALRAELTLPDGGTLTVVGTHLESAAGTDTRAEQIRTITEQLGSTSPVVVAGDMNMQPTDPDHELFDDAGFLSAQDVTGHSDESTSRDPDFPGDRVDWVFGKGVAFSGFEIASSDASDHLPVVAAVST